MPAPLQSEATLKSLHVFPAVGVGVGDDFMQHSSLLLPLAVALDGSFFHGAEPQGVGPFAAYHFAQVLSVLQHFSSAVFLSFTGSLALAPGLEWSGVHFGHVDARSDLFRTPRFLAANRGGLELRYFWAICPIKIHNNK